MPSQTELEQMVEALYKASALINQGANREAYELLVPFQSVSDEIPLVNYLTGLSLLHCRSFMAAKRSFEKYLLAQDTIPGVMESCRKNISLITKIQTSPVQSGQFGNASIDNILSIKDPRLEGLAHCVAERGGGRILYHLKEARILRPYGVIVFDSGEILEESTAGVSIVDVFNSLLTHQVRSNDPKILPCDDGLALSSGAKDREDEFWRTHNQWKIEAALNCNFAGVFVAPLQYEHVKAAFEKRGIGLDRVMSIEEQAVKPVRTWFFPGDGL